MKRLLSSSLFLTVYCWTCLYLIFVFYSEIGTQRDIVDTNLERFYCLAAISFESLGIFINLLLYRRLQKGNYRKITKNIFLFINVMTSLGLFFCSAAVYLVALPKLLGSLG